jgi:homogentisate 1,2-dioxygenase
MPYYLQRGSIPPKRHIRHEVSPGHLGEGLYYEEVITTQGFGRAYSIVYHVRPPTRVRHIESAGVDLLEPVPHETLRHVHLKTGGLEPQGDPITGRIPLMFNADVTLSRCRPAVAQRELYRNARSDELVFVHAGSGVVLTQFGELPFRPMDYIVIPKCTTYAIEFQAGSPQSDLLVVESHGDLGFPPRYLNPDGQFRLGAPFCERDLHGPSRLRTEDREEDTPVLIKDGSRWTRYVMANHPFDVVGWDGMVYPFTFNADDFEPITGTIHQPPPIHQTFQATGFVVCTFAPRMLDTHPMAVKVPYAHSNVESDEVLYYVRGQFGSRRGVELGSLTLHPHGIPHGPHPKTIEASFKMQRTDELAVMVDTFRPLQLARPAVALDDPSYPYSWMEG